MKPESAILGLRIISGLVILVGLMGVINGLVTYETIPLFVMDVPAWVLGASAMYMGIRYWRRIPELQKTLRNSAGFSWANFPRPGFFSKM